MLRVVHTKQFEKDIKLALKRGKNLSKIKAVITKLTNKETLPERMRNHKLLGKFKHRWECHVEPDWLLIYKLDSDCIIFERTGSHSDLFK